MMRGSVVFLAVFAVGSCSVGVDGAHFVKSGITGYGTGRAGNGDAPGIEESAFGNGKNDGHRIGKRSNLAHDIAEQAFRLGAARRQQMTHPNAPFPKPIQPRQYFKPVILPQFPISIPPLPTEELPPPGQTGPLSEQPWTPPPLAKSRDLPLRQVIPSLLERDLRSLTALRFLPLSEAKNVAMKIVSNALSDARILPAILPKLSAGSSFARGQDFYRSELKNRRSRYSGSRNYSPLRSYQTLPGSITDDVISMPLYRNMRDTAPAEPDDEENYRKEVKSAIVKYLVHLWSKISKLFKPDSNSGGGMGGVPPKEEIPVEDGNVVGPGHPEEHEVHTERPPEENDNDDVLIKPVTPPVDDEFQTIHFSSGEDAPGPAENSTGEGGSDVDEVYSEPIHFKPQDQTNWEIRHSARMGDVAKKIKDTSAGTRKIRKKNMRDELDTVTNIFGRLADD